jgi:two-component system phosphate regulon sensor histidine kinase PhoR
MNTAAERLLGSKRDDAAGRPFAWVVPNVDVIEALEESRERGFRVVRSVEMPNRQLLRATTERLSEGGPWSAMAVLHDVTEVRRAEQMRRDFVANVSHELRTPLASIKAVLETLEAGAISDPAAARDFLSRAETEVDRLTNMLTDLLELSRIESGAGGEPEPVDIGGAATDAVERLRSQAIRGEIALTCEVEAGLPLVAGDSERIERALINLIENAIKFTPPGGHIDVHASRREDWVAIEVSDDGAGIDDRDLPRIFERFYKADRARVRGGGTGLGLAIARHIVEGHGGRIRVESEPGVGSTFAFTLPAATGAATEARWTA